MATLIPHHYHHQLLLSWKDSIFIFLRLLAMIANKFGYICLFSLCKINHLISKPTMIVVPFAFDLGLQLHHLWFPWTWVSVFIIALVIQPPSYLLVRIRQFKFCGSIIDWSLSVFSLFKVFRITTTSAETLSLLSPFLVVLAPSLCLSVCLSHSLSHSLLSLCLSTPVE
jgi:hypothetical protein